MDWRDYIFEEDIRDFLYFETWFTRGENKVFNSAKNYVEKEEARARVLAKRLEALAQWIKFNKVKGE